MKKIMVAAVTASAFLCAVTAAQAEDGQMRVKLAGLDVATDAGAKAALTRIQFSAETFCEQTSGRESLERIYVKDRCVAEMTRKGVKQLNAPMVTALVGDRAAGEKLAQVAMAR
ncbi:UrcA family protein [Phenylobacterium sp. LjRoot225]|uniref:UrcA family protein n=1 Tax=Phenylobacterium sp. LjRoot225 TaxID=3342285 RepID=UPI003ED0F38E